MPATNPYFNQADDRAYAEFLTDILLPDLPTIDLGVPIGFPNGRQLSDDVVDRQLQLFAGTTGSSSSGPAPGMAPLGDGVDANDVPFRNVFPYLAPAHDVIPEPATGILIAATALGIVARRRKLRLM